MIIDRSYFIGEINIPNVNQTEIGGLVDLFIQKYEPEFLQSALGYELAQQFTAGIAMPTPDQKWLDLRDGAEYTDYAGKVRKWKGLVIAVPKQSIIANYIYYWFSRNKYTQTTSMGEVKSTVENSVPISPGEKMARAWNEMSAGVCALGDFLDAKVDVYPAWKGVNQWEVNSHFRRINTFGI